jgi:ubiquitin-conjugating enzyme E2 D/E
MSMTRRVQRELQEITAENKDSKNAVYSIAPEKDNLLRWSGFLFGPVGTPYEGGTFQILIELPSEYPFKPPTVTFLTKIFHPNISDTGYICLDILKQHMWSPALSLAKVMFSISSLLSDPNPNDPLMPEIASIYKRDKKRFETMARDWTGRFA